MIPFWKKTDKGGKKTPPKPAIPHTAQQSIPMQRMFEDGTCRVRANYYTRTIAYQDINTRPLTEKQASDYELRPAPDNPDRPRPIAEQMKNAAKLAEADRGSEAPAPQRRQPDRGDR